MSSGGGGSNDAPNRDETPGNDVSPTGIDESALGEAKDEEYTIERTNKIPSAKQLFVLSHIKELLSKKSKLVQAEKRKKPEASEAQVFYLNKYCADNGLGVRGNKKVLANRVLAHLFKDPTRLDIIKELEGKYDADAWKKSKSVDIEEEKKVKEIITTVRDDTDDDEIMDKEFHDQLLYLSYWAIKLKAFPQPDAENCVLYYEIKLSADALMSALSERDVSTWEKFPFLSEKVSTKKTRSIRTRHCIFRLLTIAMLDDNLYQEMITDSKDSPTREEHDMKQTNSSAPFYTKLHVAFTDDSFKIAPFHSPNDITFHDSSGNIPDITKGYSKWVSPSQLKSWLDDIEGLLRKYKTKYDKSGNHEAFSPDSVEEFCQSFAQGNKAVMYLYQLASFRGNDSIEFFKGTLPDGGADGWYPNWISFDDTSSWTIETESSSLKAVGSDDQETTTNKLLAKLLSSDDASSSAKSKYYEEKTKKLKLENQAFVTKGQVNAILMKSNAEKMLQNNMITNLRNMGMLESEQAKPFIAKMMQDMAAGYEKHMANLNKIKEAEIVELDDRSSEDDNEEVMHTDETPRKTNSAKKNKLK
jgi:hypothetical protein